jgi:hypothetical protein
MRYYWSIWQQRHLPLRPACPICRKPLAEGGFRDEDGSPHRCEPLALLRAMQARGLA